MGLNRPCGNCELWTSDSALKRAASRACRSVTGILRWRQANCRKALRPARGSHIRSAAKSAGIAGPVPSASGVLDVLPGPLIGRMTRSRAALLALPLLMNVLSAAGGQFRAGAAAVDVTPIQLPIRTAGNLTLTVVNKVHDPLHSRALVLDDGSTRLAIAVVDSCMIARDDLDAARAAVGQVTDIPAENILISSTHTHTAPAVYGCHGNDAELAYRAWLIPRITESIVQAWRNLRPARVGWGRSDLPAFVHCRRWIMRPGTAIHPNPAFTGQPTNLAMMNPGHANTNKVRQTGPVDPALSVLSLQTPDGRPLALLANYSTHYANAPGLEISADYFGEFCRLIARDLKADELNPGFVALMSNGTSGDANCSDFTKTNWPVTPVLVAQAVTANEISRLGAALCRGPTDDFQRSPACAGAGGRSAGIPRNEGRRPAHAQLGGKLCA